MILLGAQEANTPLMNFLTDPLPYGGLFIVLTILFTSVILSLAYFFFYSPRLKNLDNLHRNKERAVADLEAQEAQIKAELDELKKGEAILIRRNGALEVKLKERSSEGAE